jgi:hypothetical protein
VDPTWKERSRGEEQQMVARLLSVEKDLRTQIKSSEEQMTTLLTKLEALDQNVKLEKSMYDLAYEQSKLDEQQKRDGQTHDADADEQERMEKNKVDYLTPFLSAYPAGKALTRKQAQQVKEDCLAALKERLLERANIIQEHLEAEQAKLHQRQAMFKRQAGSGPTPQEVEEFNRFSQQCLFRIDILNARRARHEELALKKYVELDEKLNNDPRLAALHHQE